ncbi:von Willebrand factor type A domain protein [Roseimaritima multifibrata]|uniref:von Willebrand factor type A domain protein n=1 Tax=Roseimaritima multifibrata TaxID=1930274 RepID=A0A517MJM9_9BACT|nr:VWA domain-containing protein [Roseimaritima multifibrata]QDS95064.1 von Willebrand factor type A domain protein [Roseimaritima multifibrata]
MDSWHGGQWQWVLPQWFILAAVLVPLLVWFHVRSLSAFSRSQRRISLTLRILIVLALLLALTRPSLLEPTSRQMVVYAVDQSLSLDASGTEVANRYLEQVVAAGEERSGLEIRFLPFAGQPHALLDSWQNASDAGRQAGGNAEDVGTDIEAALVASLAAIPPSYVPRVVLLSDGNATRGRSAGLLANRNVPVDTVPLPVRSEPEIQVAEINAPVQVQQGEPFSLEVVVNANIRATGRIDLFADDIRVPEQADSVYQFVPGENRFRFQQSILNQRQRTYVARVVDVDDVDTLLDNNQATAIVGAAGKPRVLLLDPDVEQMDPFRWALAEQQIEVEVRPPSGMPSNLSDLQAFECLILSNISATDLTLEQMELVRTYVQDLGGGLIMLGGDQTFSLGGFYKSPLDAVLPVHSDIEKDREKPGLAIMLVIDRSGSMGGEKIELAKDAAAAAVELIGPRDSIGVLAFDNETYTISEIRPGSESAAILKQISKLDAGGGTNMYPAMEQAFHALAATNAKLKHCILLTDGISEPGAFPTLAAEMARQQMTVTTVAMGEGADYPMLEEISRIGGGRHYVCADPQSVPQVFAKETIQANQTALNELPFLPLVNSDTPALEGIDLDLAPLLMGYVVVKPKATSEVILTTEEGDPLLSWWRLGLGMSVAFTSDAKSRWASEWLAWPEFGTFWAQVIRHAMRQNESDDLQVKIQRDEDVAEFAVDAVTPDGDFLLQATGSLTILDPLQTQTVLPLQALAPGRYGTPFSTEQQGTYQLELLVTPEKGEPIRQSRSLVVGYPAELQLRPLGEKTLREIARTTGGMWNPSPLESLRPAEGIAMRAMPIWPWLVMLAIVCWVLDVASRRIEWLR